MSSVRWTLQPAAAAPISKTVRSSRFAAALIAVACLPAPAAAQTVEIVESHPARTTSLALAEALFVRLAYTSDAQIRFQASGYRAGTERREGERMNPAPAYPAGSGDALVWVAYSTPAEIDEVRVTVYDGGWQPLSSVTLPIDATWRTGSGGGSQARPEWVTRLNDAQQQATSAAMASPDDHGLLWVLLPRMIALSLLGYFILQIRAFRRWEGGWRMLALVPLVATVPIVAYTLLAYAAGSNLWPLLMIFTLPFAFLYLAALAIGKAAVRAVGRNARIVRNSG